MNERIQELAEQATVPAPYEFGGTYMAFSKEKFAELIVRECLSVSEDVANADGKGLWFDAYMSGVVEVNRRIKQRFGVKE